MKYWLFLLIPMVCIACGQSETNNDAGMESEASTATLTEAENTTPESPIEIAKTSTLISEVIEYSIDGQTYTGYLAYDSAIEGQRPGVLVVHEWWGHNDYARTRAAQLAKMGYTAFALDMYGSGKVTDHPEDAQKFMQEAIADSQQIKARFLKARDILAQQDQTNPEQIAAIGYCFGGGVVLNMARAGVDLDGVASFHGALAPAFTAEPGSVSTKVLVLHGADDAMIGSDQVEAFKAEMEVADIDYEFISYPGAQHSFTNPIATEVGEKYQMPVAYSEEADAKSWSRLSEFLASLWAH